MKKSRYTEAQILSILRQGEGGVPVAELCREHGMSNASFYKWRAKYGGMPSRAFALQNPAGYRRVHDQPDEGHGVRRKRHWSESAPNENRRLKRMYADLSMQADLLKEALGKK
ncbi:transposase [Pseudorhodobacter aquimaris]|uniref:transposase n=1 Tax=Pseudorhodobacter aquimaris TaxID=687412 RepID=UPI00067C9355